MQRTASPDTSDAGIDQELAAKGKTAPRITSDDIKANIVSEHYFTALDGAMGSLGTFAEAVDTSQYHESLRLLTICVLVLRNGFTVTGESACASPKTFDAEIGRKLAKSKALDKVWMLMGYELRTRLAAEADANVTPADEPDQARVKSEYHALCGQEGRLRAFLADPANKVSAAERDHMQRQVVAQNALAAILAERIAAFGGTKD